MRTRCRAHHERGATVVEYALVMALVVAGGLGGIRFFQSQSSSELRARGNAGAPDLDDTYADIVTTVPTTLTPDGGATTIPAAVDMVTDIAKSASKDRGDWVATVIVKVSSTTGTIAPEMRVTGRWTVNPAGTTIDVSCITQADGTCPLTLADLDKKAQTSVSFVVTSVTGSGVGNVSSGGAVTIGAP